MAEPTDTIYWHAHFARVLEERTRLEDERWEAHRREQIMRDKEVGAYRIEIERRLAALNHEAEQLKRMQDTYVPREVFSPESTKLADLVTQVQTVNAQNAEKMTYFSMDLSSIREGLQWSKRMTVGALVTIGATVIAGVILFAVR